MLTHEHVHGLFYYWTFFTAVFSFFLFWQHVLLGSCGKASKNSYSSLLLEAGTALLPTAQELGHS